MLKPPGTEEFHVLYQNFDWIVKFKNNFWDILRLTYTALVLTLIIFTDNILDRCLKFVDDENDIWRYLKITLWNNSLHLQM